MLTYAFRTLYKKCVFGLHFSIQHPTNHWLFEEKKLAPFNSSLVHLIFIIPSSWFPSGLFWACACKGSRCEGTFKMHAPNMPPPSLPPLVKILLLLTRFPSMSFTYHSHLSKVLWKQSRRWTAVLWSKVASRLHTWGFQEKREVLGSSAGKASKTLERPSQKKPSYLPQQSGLSALGARCCLGKLKKSNCHLNWRGRKKWEGAICFRRCRNHGQVHASCPQAGMI